MSASAALETCTTSPMPAILPAHTSLSPLDHPSLKKQQGVEKAIAQGRYSLLLSLQTHSASDQLGNGLCCFIGGLHYIACGIDCVAEVRTAGFKQFLRFFAEVVGLMLQIIGRFFERLSQIFNTST